MLKGAENFQQEQETDKERLEEQEPKADSQRVGALMESGKFSSEQEAQVFLENMDKALAESTDFEKVAERFTGEFDNVLKEAISQLESIEGLSEGDFEDSKKELMDIILGIADNYEDVKQALRGEGGRKGFSLMDIPKKLGWFIKKNKVAFTAFTAISLFSRMGGEAEAGEIDWSNPDISADIERIVDGAQEDDFETKSDVSEKITGIVDEVRSLQGQEGVMGSYGDSVSGKYEINMDVDRILSDLQEKGEVNYDVKQFVVSQQAENSGSENGKDISDYKSRMEVSNVFFESENQDFETGENVREEVFGYEAESRESAVLGALLEAAAYQGVAVENLLVNEAESAGAGQSSEVENISRQAFDQTIRVTGIEVEEYETSLEDGTKAARYSAKLSLKMNI